MYKVILLISLVVASNSVQAEWVKINTKDNLTTYIDPATITKVDNMVKMWGIVDLKESRKEQNGKEFLSAKGLQEYDCKTVQIRKISLALYAGNMGAGEVVNTYADADKWQWTPVAPGSVSETMWKTACDKK
jgi:hypothetical protein